MRSVLARLAAVGPGHEPDSLDHERLLRGPMRCSTWRTGSLPATINADLEIDNKVVRREQILRVCVANRVGVVVEAVVDRGKHTRPHVLIRVRRRGRAAKAPAAQEHPL